MRVPPSSLGDLVTTFALTSHPANPDGWRSHSVRGVRADNRLIRDGDLFAGHAGGHVHGAQFARAAVAAGAVAVLTDPAGSALLASPEYALPPQIPVLIAEEVPALLGALAAEVYGHPAERLRTFALTGTNGKTTTTYMLDHVLRSLGRVTGLIGTVEVRIADRAEPAALTTPQPADLQALLAEMVNTGVSDLAMEVSSHALGLGRVNPVVFDVAGFTNLTQDHLDYHGTLEDYFAAKASLFTEQRSGRGVAVVADSWGRRLADSRPDGYRLSTVAGAEATGDWRIGEIVPDGTGHAFTLSHRDGRRLRTRTGLPGTFNVTNAALAAAMVLDSGVEAATLETALVTAQGITPVVPGRMEQLADRPRVVVDFAHNPGALTQAIDALRPTTQGRLILVFGATGSRDRGKRPEMAKIAVEGADLFLLTDDDPHDEPAADVRAEVLSAAHAHRRAAGGGAQIQEIGDRADAIRAAVLDAEDADTVLVAGRGHETIQEVAGIEYHLDDREEVRAALARRAHGAGRSSR